MIFKFDTFVSESYNTKNPANFFILVAIGVFNPELLSFVNTIRNKYTLTATEVNQSLLIELKKTKNIILNCSNINTASILSSIEEDWSLIKKAYDSSEKIRNNFPNISNLIVSDKHIEVETDNGSLSIGREASNKFSSRELMSKLAIDERTLYSDNNWEQFVSQWCTLLKANVKTEYIKAIDIIINHKELTWNKFIQRRKDTLGVKINSLPKLYYNNLYDLSKDLAYNELAFINYNSFIQQWIIMKKNFYFNGLLLPTINNKLKEMSQSGELDILFNELIEGKKNTNNHSYVLGSSGLLVQDKIATASNAINYKLLSNRKSDLIIDLNSEDNKAKILVSTTQIFPSKIKISYKNNG